MPQVSRQAGMLKKRRVTQCHGQLWPLGTCNDDSPEEWVMRWTGLELEEGCKSHLQASFCKVSGVEGSTKTVEVDAPLCKT